MPPGSPGDTLLLAVTATFTITDATVESFEASRSQFTADLASLLSVSSTAITLEVSAGSVVVYAAIRSIDAAEQATVSAALRQDEAILESALQVSLAGAPFVRTAVLTLPAPSPTPPSPPLLSSPPPIAPQSTTSSGDALVGSASGGGSLAGLAAVAAVLLAVVGAACCWLRRRRKRKKGLRASGFTSCSSSDEGHDATLSKRKLGSRASAAAARKELFWGMDNELVDTATIASVDGAAAKTTRAACDSACNSCKNSGRSFNDSTAMGPANEKPHSKRVSWLKGTSEGRVHAPSHSSDPSPDLSVELASVELWEGGSGHARVASDIGHARIEGGLDDDAGIGHARIDGSIRHARLDSDEELLSIVPVSTPGIEATDDAMERMRGHQQRMLAQAGAAGTSRPTWPGQESRFTSSTRHGSLTAEGATSSATSTATSSAACSPANPFEPAPSPWASASSQLRPAVQAMTAANRMACLPLIDGDVPIGLSADDLAQLEALKADAEAAPPHAIVAGQPPPSAICLKSTAPAGAAVGWLEQSSNPFAFDNEDESRARESKAVATWTAIKVGAANQAQLRSAAIDPFAPVPQHTSVEAMARARQGKLSTTPHVPAALAAPAIIDGDAPIGLSAEELEMLLAMKSQFGAADDSPRELPVPPSSTERNHRQTVSITAPIQSRPAAPAVSFPSGWAR